MNIGDITTGIGTVFQLVGDSAATTILSVVGLVLLLLAAILANRALTTDPQNVTVQLKSALFISLIGGMLFSAAGPGLALFWVSQSSIKKTTAQTSLDNLEYNKQVNWVVRLISYNNKQEPDRGIDRLQHLGPPKQLYSFVASQEDLVGYTVKEALEMIGVKYTPGDRVSAIIFPLRTAIFPANARGLLQVIQEVETRKDTEIKERFLQGNNSLSGEEIKNLKVTDIPSYRIAKFEDKYKRYCQLAYDFLCSDKEYSAKDYIGTLYHDWHPLGFSQKKPQGNACEVHSSKYCEFSDWKTAKANFRDNFGSRAFLIRNLEIDRIPGRILIDFENPTEQIIPDIGVR